MYELCVPTGFVYWWTFYSCGFCILTSFFFTFFFKSLRGLYLYLFCIFRSFVFLKSLYSRSVNWISLNAFVFVLTLHALWLSFFMTCILHGLRSLWLAFLMTCILYGLRSLWLAFFMTCILYGLHSLFQMKSFWL